MSNSVSAVSLVMASRPINDMQRDKYKTIPIPEHYGKALSKQMDLSDQQDNVFYYSISLFSPAIANKVSSFIKAANS